MDFHHISHPHPFRPAADLDKFYVVTVISNPVRFMRRYELYWRFAEMCRCAGVHLVTVEQAFGERPWMVTVPDNPLNVQVRSYEELWLKENMINLGIERAREHGATKIAWVDADCAPMQPPRRWFEETWHALQHYEFCQMWSSMVDLDENQRIVAQGVSFMNNYLRFGTGAPKTQHETGYSVSWGRPGLAWAANVDALDKVGGLIDFTILGSGDWYAARALVGQLDEVIPKGVLVPYYEKIRQWGVLCERWIKRDVGMVQGSMWHDWHGTHKNRQYDTRDQILVRADFNPDTDLKYDSYGLLQLETWEPRQIRLRDEIRGYFRQRNEDGLREA